MPTTPIEIGWVPAEFILDTPTEGDKQVKEETPRDRLGSLIAGVPPPQKSLKSADTSGSSGPSKRDKKLEVSDCQWWTMQVIKHLVEQGYLIAPQRG